MGLTTDYRTMITRGRKAGLSTRELYSAMSTRPMEGSDQILGQSDCNGYISSFTTQGHRVYQPLGKSRRG
jgi:hypothetical protein